MKKVNSISFSIEQLSSVSFKSAGIVVDVSQNSIEINGETITTQPKVIELLVTLCSFQGQTVSKEELISRLWPDIVVGPDSLANCMARLRKVLGDDVKEPKYIQTVQRKGYRWLPPVELKKISSNKPNKRTYLMIISAFFCVSIISVWATYNMPAKEASFPFSDISVKKLPDGGYQIDAGIEGELTEERQMQILEEIRRITNEQNTGMEFTFDSLTSHCNLSKTKIENQTHCKNISSKLD